MTIVTLTRPIKIGGATVASVTVRPPIAADFDALASLSDLPLAETEKAARAISMFTVVPVREALALPVADLVALMTAIAEAVERETALVLAMAGEAR